MRELAFDSMAKRNKKKRNCIFPFKNKINRNTHNLSKLRDYL